MVFRNLQLLYFLFSLYGEAALCLQQPLAPETSSFVGTLRLLAVHFGG